MYKIIAVGGTFDHLHRGHRIFISKAFKLGERVVIGVTSDEYVMIKSKIQMSNQAQNHNVKIQNFKTRREEIEKFLREKGWGERAKIVKIDDVFGGMEKEVQIEAIVVTGQTREGAEKINKSRKSRGLKVVEVEEVEMVLAEDGRPISSTRVREGEIDREGRNYKLQIINYKLIINEKIRKELRKPQGVLIKGKQGEKEYWRKKLGPILRNSFVICVGDEVTRTVNMINFPVQLYIFDYRIQRKKVFESIEQLGFKEVHKVYKVYKVNNPAGRITNGLVETVDKAIRNVLTRLREIPRSLDRGMQRPFFASAGFTLRRSVLSRFPDRKVEGASITRKQQLIEVEGEEDLAAVPAILLAPLGTKVLYGQPNEGVVVVEVTDECKWSLLGIMNYE